MNRHIVLALVAVALVRAPIAGAQSTDTTTIRTARDREREQARLEREREKAEEAAERKREKAEEAAERKRDEEERVRDREQERRDRLQEKRDRDLERARERRERDAAGALDTTVAFDARGTITVTCPGGEVVVTASDRNEIRVHARTESGAIRFSSSGSRASLEPTSGRGCSEGRFEVTVPTGTRLTANSWSGRVNVRGVHGDIDAHSQSGDIEVHDAGDHLEVESLSGSVEVDSVKGDATINTVSGDIQLNGARGQVEIETVSGDMQLRDVVSRQVRTHSTSGDLTFAGQILDAGRYEFNTHSGEVRLQLPGNVGAQLTVSTFNGGIESDFPITLKTGEHGIGSAQAKRLNFVLGQGTARIIAETFSGDITLTSSGRPR
ncbi:MAG: hypothetical protein JWN53_593 [Gemmatimonadetes bacterium]|jgi:DUF4097 and DUF4098 domain-containing protein YvlB|nr:hypothetical protein [Gemmatimonadota bacterium]